MSAADRARQAFQNWLRASADYQTAIRFASREGQQSAWATLMGASRELLEARQAL